MVRWPSGFIVKYKQLNSGFELELLILFPSVITIALRSPPQLVLGWRSKGKEGCHFYNVNDDRLKKSHTVKTAIYKCLYMLNKNTKLTVMIDTLFDWLQWHINSSRVILCLDVRELRSLYIHVYIFCAVISHFGYL